ncbi:serine hydrolase domain-containing protein [Streptomyces venezuelae]|uniref:serine hydrolase domain-containing protein n=1 Tax=Streptomyces venezuelae TaxID=54571 RepID=UPI001CC25405|nr:serine hydrolase domain-containing protein [Streptomyces venezuelae]
MQRTHATTRNDGRKHRARRPAPAAAVLALALLAATAPAATAADGGRIDRLDRQALAAELRAVHEAGVYGAYSAVRDGHARWKGAAGLADLDTRRPTSPDLRHRVGSVTKSFTAVAVLQQVANGRIRLDQPIGDHLPGLVPGERGRKVTVRMLLNHTSGIADYVAEAFPSLKQADPSSLDEHRHRTIAPTELIRLGVGLPQTFEPGTDWGYSNTNYILLGELLRKVTGQDPERVITRDVIRKAGLRDTWFPGTQPAVRGPHARMYENLHGLIDPPRDYSTYNMTWAGTAGALISTQQDLNTFYRRLLAGELLPAAQLREMRTTWPVKAPDGSVGMRYGLGIYSMDTSCGPVWGHDGGVFGAGTWALSTPEGKRQFAVGWNLTKYQRLDEAGQPIPHAADEAMGRLMERALCGTAPAAGGTSKAAPKAAPKPVPKPAPKSAPLQRIPLNR